MLLSSPLTLSFFVIILYLLPKCRIPARKPPIQDMSFPGTFYSTSARTDCRSYTILCKSSPGLIILTISPFLAFFPKLYFSTVFRNCISQQQYFPTAFINGSIIPTTAFLFIFIIVQDDPRLVIYHKSGV